MLIKTPQLFLILLLISLCLILLMPLFLPPLPLNLPYTCKESIYAILDEQIVSTRDGGVHRFLVQCRGRPDSNCTWITQDELQRLDPDFLEYYKSSLNFHSIGSSSSHPRGVYADTRYKPPIIHMYGRKRKKKTAQPVALWMEPFSYWA